MTNPGTPAKTQHTCNGGRGPAFGRKTPGCPRCDELIAGAAPRQLHWAERARTRREEEERRIREIREHDCKRSRCSIVCTAFDW